MSVEIKVPALPESVVDAVVAGWHKQAGDSVNQDESLVDLETDKVILEVPAICNGVIKEIRFKVGDTVTADQVLAVIDDMAVVTAQGQVAMTVAEPGAELAQQSEPAGTEQSEAEISLDLALSPSARKLMAENSIKASEINGSGKGGRVLKEDVLAFLENKLQTQAVENQHSEPAVSARKPGKSPLFEPGVVEGRIEKRVPMTRLRARIAERLLEAQQNAAILTTFNEVNMKPVMELRATYKDRFEHEYGVKLGFMSFFVKAVVEALKKFPAVNASIDSNDIVYHGYYDIGIAVSGPNGLVVPILRNVEDMTLAQIEQAIITYATRASDNSLSIEDITGGTFTISNGGVFGSMLSTPILNPPQSGILGMHTIKQRPMVVDGEITVLPMMYLALSYDHRIIDGREAVQFLVTIKDMLEEPSRMLLGV
jgi:2-oxoglutarate dehydrogenase E2 component (dihydrolipoamide succinyltransferase)